MSTEYILANGAGCELTLDEHSCKFDLSLTPASHDFDNPHVTIMRDMSIADVKNLALRMLQVCGYFYEDATIEDLKRLRGMLPCPEIKR